MLSMAIVHAIVLFFPPLLTHSSTPGFRPGSDNLLALVPEGSVPAGLGNPAVLTARHTSCALSPRHTRRFRRLEGETIGVQVRGIQGQFRVWVDVLSFFMSSAWGVSLSDQ